MNPDYRELHRLEQRLRNIRDYMKTISPVVGRYQELKKEGKELIKKIHELSV